MTNRNILTNSVALASFAALDVISIGGLSVYAQEVPLSHAPDDFSRAKKELRLPTHSGSTSAYLHQASLLTTAPTSGAYTNQDGEVPAGADGKNDTIVVTGTHIRGAAPAGANVDIYTSEDIENSGYATVQDFIQTLPQVFQGGGGTEDAVTGDLITSNRFSGSSANLRGLGADSTLILVNGRRVPQSGLEGNFTDISSIPQVAVKRIEILPDGASALYGADAVGGVINILMRNDFDGADSRFRYGAVTNGDHSEYRATQTFGKTWSNGSFFINYEFYRRTELANSGRSFAENADLRPLGGGDYRTYFSHPGNILDPVTFMPAYAIPENQNGRSLKIEDLIPGKTNLHNQNATDLILPDRKHHTVYLNTEYSISSTATLFLDGRYHNRKIVSGLDALTTTLVVDPRNPFFVDPFNAGYTIVSYSFSEDGVDTTSRGKVKSAAGAGGFIIDINKWQLNAYASYGRESSRLNSLGLDTDAINSALIDSNPNTAFNPFGDGNVNNPETIRSLFLEALGKSKSTLFNANMKADGPLFRLNGSNIAIALGADYRHEKLSSSMRSGGEPIADEKLSRNIYAIFSEISVPLVNHDESVILLNRLDISIAGRYDHYEDIGDTFNPKVGATWSPVTTLNLKASYGTSYRAPNLTELVTALNSSAILSLTDPRSPSGSTRALLLFGNDPDISSEKAKSWTFGFTLEPAFPSNTSISANYFKTTFKNRIGGVDSGSTVLQHENLYSSVIIRNPSQEMLREICTDARFSGNLYECRSDIVGAVVNLRTQNISKNIVKGIDFNANHAIQIKNGSLSLGLSGTYLIDFATQQVSTAPVIDRVDTLSNPVDLRLRGHASFALNHFSGTVIVNYTDSYRNDQSLRQKMVNNFITTDMHLAIDLRKAFAFSAKEPVTLSLSAINIFNEKSPFVDNPAGIGYDPTNSDPVGRFLAAELRITW